MPIVKMPNGDLVKFPDDMAPADIKAFIAKKFPSVLAQAAQPNALPAQQQNGSLLNTLSQGASGINEGLAGTLGFPVEMVNDAMRAGAAGVHALGGPNVQIPTNPVGGQQFFQNLMSPTIAAPTGDMAGQIARRIGNDVGAAALPGMGAAAVASRPLASMLVNTASSLGSGIGAAGADQAAQALAPNNPAAARLADLAGEAVGSFGPAAVSKAITPFAVGQDALAQSRMASVQALQRQGVDLTAGQQVANKPLQYAESELGGGAELNNRQKQQFTQAALRQAGVQAPLATPAVMNQAFSDIGDRFNQLGASTGITPDQQLGSDLANVVKTYKNVVSPSNQAPIVDNTMQDIIGYAKAGKITGAQYQDLRSRLGQAIGQTDGPLNGALRGIQTSLDSGLGRTLAATDPQAMQNWQQARQDYANLMRIKEAMSGAGEDAANGIVSPQRLRTVTAGNNPAAYVRGQNDMGNLARAGVSGMTPLPQSGTAPRNAVHAIPTAIGAALGSMAGMHAGGPEGGLIGAAMGSIAPPMLGKALMSRPMQGYLANQLMAGAQPSAATFIGPLSAALIHQAGMQ